MEWEGSRSMLEGSVTVPSRCFGQRVRLSERSLNPRVLLRLLIGNLDCHVENEIMGITNRDREA